MELLLQRQLQDLQCLTMRHFVKFYWLRPLLAMNKKMCRGWIKKSLYPPKKRYQRYQITWPKFLRRKSSIDENSQYLAQLCDKVFDAEDRANRANQKEILCWSLYAKDFRTKLNGIIESSGDKFGEKKARGLLYDSIAKQLNLLRKQRSQETGLQLRDVSRDSLRKKTQRAEKVYKFIERVGLDKIKYIKSYSATSISERL